MYAVIMNRISNITWVSSTQVAAGDCLYPLQRIQKGERLKHSATPLATGYLRLDRPADVQ